MSEPRKPGRPRKWKSDAERMRAKRAAQRAARGTYEKEQQEASSTSTDLPVENPQQETIQLTPDELKDLVGLDRLLEALHFEGPITDWLHRECSEQYRILQYAYHTERELVRELMADYKSLDHRARRMCERLEEVDPGGPFAPPVFITSKFPELKDM